jgi:serine protease inhibitor
VVDDAWPGPRVRTETVRFTVEAQHDLLERAELFGLGAVAANGSFPGISRVPLPVAEARQEAMARFGATGFEASAVTAVMMATGFIQHDPVRSLAVSFDRPFGFAARSRTTGLVLVAGWVTDPEPWAEPRYS